LTCKTVSHITYTVLVETLNSAHSLTHSLLQFVMDDVVMTVSTV